VHPILLIQVLQAIKLKQDNNGYINQVDLIRLLRDDCHKQAVTHIREVTAIRIDVYPTWENPTNM
jgi:hypothetical protein